MADPFATVFRACSFDSSEVRSDRLGDDFEVSQRRGRLDRDQGISYFLISLLMVNIHTSSFKWHSPMIQL